MDVSLAPDRIPAFKLLMTADAVGGVWQYSVDLLSRLARHDVHAILATMGPRPSDEQRRQVAAIPGLTLEESDFALEWMPTPWADVDLSAGWLRQLCDRYQPDLLHLNSYSQASKPWAQPVLCVGHSCVYSWWRAVRGGFPDESWSEYHRRVTSGLHSCDAIVAPSLAMATSLRNEYQLPADSVRVINNFADGPVESLPKEAFVLAAGRLWDPAKNLSLLDGIAPHLDWPVRVAGDPKGPVGTSLHAPALELLGFLPQSGLQRALASASIFAHPALYEPFGLAVLQAARHSCCLVLADIPSLRELWNGAAIFCDPRDPDSWISELNKLTRNASLRAAHSERALQRSRQYGPEVSVRAYLELYRELLLKKSAGRGVAA